MTATQEKRKQATLAALTSRLELEPADVIERIVDALTRSLDRIEPLEGSLWGRAPEPGEVAAVEARGLARERADREAVVERSLPRREVAALLGISGAAVGKKLDKRQLVGVKRGREWRLPRWQIGPDGALRGIAELSRAFPGGVVALSLWAERPHPDLEGRTPGEALADGEVDAAVRAAQAITATGW